MARKAIRSISISGANATTGGGVVEATVGVGEEVETDAIGAYGDSHYTNVPRNIAQYKDVTITFLNEAGDITGLGIGKVATVTLTYAVGDGKGDDVTSTVSKDMVVVDYEGNDVAVDGERKATVTVILRPHGGNTTPANT